MEVEQRAVPKKIAHLYTTVFASARTLQDNWPSRGLFRPRRFHFTDSFDLKWIRHKSLWRYDVSKIGQFCDHDFFVKEYTFIACENSPQALVLFCSNYQRPKCCQVWLQHRLDLRSTSRFSSKTHLERISVRMEDDETDNDRKGCWTSRERMTRHLI